MPNQVFCVRRNGVSFYLNTETSSQGRRSGTRFRLYKTTHWGLVKAGYVQVGMKVGRALQKVAASPELFDSCEMVFMSKPVRNLYKSPRVQDLPPARNDVVASQENQNLKHQEVTDAKA